MGLIVGCLTRVEVVAGEADFRTYRADPTCIGVNDTAANRNTSGETQVGGGLFAEVPC